MSLSGIFKFILGFFVGIIFLIIFGIGTAYYFWTRLSITPAKPIFAEEQQKKSPTVKKASLTPASKSKPSSQQSPTPSKSPIQELPPGAYKARVTWPEGLSLRDAPTLNSTRIGGVAANQAVFILKQSDDGKWQQVRVVEGNQEGWIKAGNTAKSE
ncbi:SH3 domain-containing protein [Allocoleopsis franciscana]|uniref:SH3 domain-containing protein n=1 Tax=Allocoleopsis franciscana PCC 7113 TaxID=1173027 RepID=K9WP36_9CYAN|nr:SH3 domain-containing protein [Allocoleopsis franciscana]AFZ21549.1 SH3 domain-containing protein [Allocoleopsis franciscana PCC 7113]